MLNDILNYTAEILQHLASLFILLLPAFSLGFAVLFSIREVHIMTMPEKKVRYWVPGLFWTLFYLFAQI